MSIAEHSIIEVDDEMRRQIYEGWNGFEDTESITLVGGNNWV